MKRKLLDLAVRIRELRKARQWNQAQLAARCGVSREAVTQWESGSTKNIRNDALVALSDVFDVSIDELLTGENYCVRDGEGAYKAKAISLEEQKLLDEFRKLTAHDRLRLVEIAEVLSRHQGARH